MGGAKEAFQGYMDSMMGKKDANNPYELPDVPSMSAPVDKSLLPKDDPNY